jgi:DNA-binding phage protein
LQAVVVVLQAVVVQVDCCILHLNHLLSQAVARLLSLAQVEQEAQLQREQVERLTETQQPSQV